MRVVIDTNVLVSGVFFGGLPARVLDAWRDGQYDLVVSPGILDEYRRLGEELARHFPSVSLDPFLRNGVPGTADGSLAEEPPRRCHNVSHGDRPAARLERSAWG